MFGCFVQETLAVNKSHPLIEVMKQQEQNKEERELLAAQELNSIDRSRAPEGEAAAPAGKGPSSICTVL